MLLTKQILVLQHPVNDVGGDLPYLFSVFSAHAIRAAPIHGGNVYYNTRNRCFLKDKECTIAHFVQPHL